MLVSAGFDAHRLDPMADLCLSDGDYAAMAASVARYVDAPGRLAFFLEGGYDFGALRSSVGATLAAAIDAPYRGEPRSNGGPGDEQVDRAKALRQAAIESWTRQFEKEGPL